MTPTHAAELRIGALRRFAVGISLLTIAGHLFLGFEMAYAHPIVALITAYGLEMIYTWVWCATSGNKPAFLSGGVMGLIDFLLPAHISALACAMLIYTNETYMPLVFCVAFAVGSKYIFRIPVGGGRTRHFLNPSNAGISVTLVLFPWIGAAPPYQFTNYVSDVWQWLLPAVVICAGTFLNWRFTRRLYVIIGWIAGFILQALLRGSMDEFSLLHALSPITGFAFWIFTFYMISDPATTPSNPSGQFIFGLSVAALYAFMDLGNVVYQIFFALLIVCCVRGVLIALSPYLRNTGRVTGFIADNSRILF